ncbi:MAG: peptidase S41 [Rhodobacterales bacterium CG_4_9_14_3_um_filter_71_31]|nr:MAG: peptidase S41 [Rhodobacterales bacterium CG_4_9_14_3_um_filter_71_31]
MKRNLAMAAFGGAVVGVLAVTQLGAPLAAQQSARKSTYEQLDLFGDVFERVRGAYVEEVDEAKLIESAINGMLASLDPHSSYLAPKGFEDMRVQTKGEFGGLGIEVTMEEGLVKVVAPMDDTPAALAGVMAGDLITHIDDEPVMGLTLGEAVERMRGLVGTDIKLTVARRDAEGPLDLTLTRAVIKIKAVRARAEGDVAVLRVTTFNEQTFDNLKAGIDEVQAELGGADKVKGYVIDLRNNPGGLLNQAIAVSDAFLDKGEIVSTRGRDPRDSERHNARAGDLAGGKPIVVLINEGSASASEIVAGALQDHRRAIVVGAKSFGKGSVQTIMPLSGEGALRLTTARYYTPSGRSIQALGIEPDILVEQRTIGEQEAATVRPGRSEADLRGSLENVLTDEEREQWQAERARHEATAKLRTEDLQLAYALDLLTGLSVYSQAQ